MDLIKRFLSIALAISIVLGAENRFLFMQTGRILTGIEGNYIIADELDPPPDKPS